MIMIKHTDLKKATKLVTKLNHVSDALKALSDPETVELHAFRNGDSWIFDFNEYEISLTTIITDLTEKRESLIKDLADLGVSYDPEAK